ncbi:sodium-dependent proline transporter-like isoform X2 [Tubulanus polymorphus]|uniref:sodium-dependent proline transporter-like isoform X2 n=1 Tax=Tubulanus polymorphus TaxID=672921 RepID=UPI003DA2D2F7
MAQYKLVYDVANEGEIDAVPKANHDINNVETPGNDDNVSDTGSNLSGDENKDRGNWSGKLDFLLSCLSYAVGLGNLWRFPYLCYSNGGGAFLIPYVIMLALAGVPLFFMELAFGQYASLGVVTIWKISPLFQGIGWGMFLVSFFVGIYYNMIIAWTLFYLFASFSNLPGVPWSTCENHWNTPECNLLGLSFEKNCTTHNGTWYNRTCYTVAEYGLHNYTLVQNLSKIEDVASKEKKSLTSPSDEYFHNYVLDITPGIHDLGGIKWELVLCLLLAWMIVGACLIKGIKSAGKAVYFTATFPYIVLIALLVRGATLPGCVDGILFYLTPEWHRLKSAKVWGDAAVQIFFSLSPCWGGLITLASFNKFHNNCLRDSLVVSLGNCLTSIFAGFVIFGIIGFMANELGVSIKDVAKDGAGLAFVVYPEVVTRLPISPFWAIIFFAMLLTLGMGTQFAVVTTVHTTIVDTFHTHLRKGRRSQILLACICFGCFLLGLTCCSRGGMYMLQLMDNYCATYSVLLIGFTECMVIAWVYGVNRFYGNINEMIDMNITPWWKYCWKFITPALILFIMIFTWIDFKPSKYGDHIYPVWADALGWMISITTIMPIPAVAIYKIATFDNKEYSIWQRIKYLSQPTTEWGPALEQNRTETQMTPFTSTHESQMPLKQNVVIESSSNIAVLNGAAAGQSNMGISDSVFQSMQRIGRGNNNESVM